MAWPVQEAKDPMFVRMDMAAEFMTALHRAELLFRLLWLRCLPDWGAGPSIPQWNCRQFQSTTYLYNLGFQTQSG